MDENLAMRNYLAWINGDFSPEIKTELRGIVGRPDEIIERFGDGLDLSGGEFASPVEMGSSRINVYTIADTAKAIASTLKGRDEHAHGVAIAYDTRRDSKELAELMARVIGEAGIRVFITDDARPEPILRHALKYYGAALGIMIGAGAKPENWNGIRLYRQNTNTIEPNLIFSINENRGSTANAIGLVNYSTSLEELEEEGRIRYWAADIGNEYAWKLLEFISGVRDPKQFSDSARENVRIIYTPLNGTGNKPIRRLLETLGYTSLLVPPEQTEGTGEFVGVSVPDPREEESYALAIKYAKMSMADAIIATDPACEIVGMAIPNKQGDYEVLSQDRLDTLLDGYVMSESFADGKFSDFVPISENADAITKAIIAAEMTALSKSKQKRLYEQFDDISRMKDYEATMNEREEHYANLTGGQ